MHSNQAPLYLYEHMLYTRMNTYSLENARSSFTPTQYSSYRVGGRYYCSKALQRRCLILPQRRMFGSVPRQLARECSVSSLRHHTKYYSQRHLYREEEWMFRVVFCVSRIVVCRCCFRIPLAVCRHSIPLPFPCLHSHIHAQMTGEMKDHGR